MAPADWEYVLYWWLDKEKCPVQPKDKQVPLWFGYVAETFIYKSCWGLGCVLSLEVGIHSNVNSFELSLDTWSTLGLPWAAFWLKELLSWGTLDPVVAFILAKGEAATRPEAKTLAAKYYQEASVAGIVGEDLIDPRRIRDWLKRMEEQRKQSSSRLSARLSFSAEMKCTFDWSDPEVKVLPVAREGLIDWVDPAGFLLASSARPPTWGDNMIDDYDFTLDGQNAQVHAERFL